MMYSPLRNRDGNSADVHGLVSLAHEAHLDAGVVSIVDGVVLEGVELEVRVELAIEPGEEVQIECGSNAAAVVIGGVQHGCVLADVDAEQECAAAHALSQRGEQLRRANAREVTDRRARKKHERPFRG